MDLLSEAANRFRWKLQSLRNYAGWDQRNWLRVRQIEAFEAFLDGDGRSKDSVLEISPGWNSHWKDRCSNYRSADFPEFDICKDRLPETFRTVIADQVLEHVRRPVPAVQNIHAMVANGGSAMVATPFLFRIHGRPHDFNRWTPAGLRQLLVDGGFDDSKIDTYSWGNKACARAHIGGPVRDLGWGRDLSNDDEYPLMVWAFAKKSAQ